MDRDGDGLSNDREVDIGTDPDDSDTDDDGIEDGIEVGDDEPTDPLNPDSDGDGLFETTSVVYSGGGFLRRLSVAASLRHHKLIRVCRMWIVPQQAAYAG